MYYGIQFITEDELAMWLHQAKAAHTEYEAANGPDADWPEWYAHYIWENAGMTLSEEDDLA